eukprot:Lankesteria_metandrocarpae@DN3641_c0_g1_i1.p1
MDFSGNFLDSISDCEDGDKQHRNQQHVPNRNTNMVFDTESPANNDWLSDDDGFENAISSAAPLPILTGRTTQVVTKTDPLTQSSLTTNAMTVPTNAAASMSSRTTSAVDATSTLEDPFATTNTATVDLASPTLNDNPTTVQDSLNHVTQVPSVYAGQEKKVNAAATASGTSRIVSGDEPMFQAAAATADEPTRVGTLQRPGEIAPHDMQLVNESHPSHFATHTTPSTAGQQPVVSQSKRESITSVKSNNANTGMKPNPRTTPTAKATATNRVPHTTTSNTFDTNNASNLKVAVPSEIFDSAFKFTGDTLFGPDTEEQSMHPSREKALFGDYSPPLDHAHPNALLVEDVLQLDTHPTTTAPNPFLRDATAQDSHHRQRNHHSVDKDSHGKRSPWRQQQSGGTSFDALDNSSRAELINDNQANTQQDFTQYGEHSRGVGCPPGVMDTEHPVVTGSTVNDEIARQAAALVIAELQPQLRKIENKLDNLLMKLDETASSNAVFGNDTSPHHEVGDGRRGLHGNSSNRSTAGAGRGSGGGSGNIRDLDSSRRHDNKNSYYDADHNSSSGQGNRRAAQSGGSRKGDLMDHQDRESKRYYKNDAAGGEAARGARGGATGGLSQSKDEWQPENSRASKLGYFESLDAQRMQQSQHVNIFKDDTSGAPREASSRATQPFFDDFVEVQKKREMLEQRRKKYIGSLMTRSTVDPSSTVDSNTAGGTVDNPTVSTANVAPVEENTAKATNKGGTLFDMNE